MSEKHRTRLASYQEALQTYNQYCSLDHKGLSFKPSTSKDDPSLKFIATNLHYQEMRVYVGRPDDTVFSLPPVAIYDYITFGAPTAFVCKSKRGLKQLEEKRDKNLARMLATPGDTNKKHLRERKLELIDFEIQERRDISLCQAATALVTSFIMKLDRCLANLPSYSGPPLNSETSPTRTVYQKQNPPLPISNNNFSASSLQNYKNQIYNQSSHNFYSLSFASNNHTHSYTQAQSLLLLEEMASLGFLIEFESLLSTHGAELAMLGDMCVAIKYLRNCCFRISRQLEENMSWSSSTCSPMKYERRKFVTSKEHSHYVFDVSLPEDLFNRLPTALQNGSLIRTVPILFTQGINEQQSIANAVGSTALQKTINLESFQQLELFYQRFKNFHAARYQQLFTAPRGRPLSINGNKAQLDFAAVDSHMQKLERLIRMDKKEKSVELLMITAEISRCLHASRSTSCKSAKDRTGMAITFEQASVLSQRHNMNYKDVLIVANMMRTSGVRRENALKNTGKDKYAFSPIQLHFLPEEYRAPSNLLCGALNS
eukprot:TRINITY_DN5781_c0_g1_i3.p1 TRINITY_DN5781_c0_g1~~TRINITY_DN5781_c0_g1_i3.p1  ORF type:complete len:543 (+),score=88.94 TRINITY_DN5781_c0_g1_i3:1205-2833(+)